MSELILRKNVYKNSRLFKNPNLKVCKDVEYIKYLEESMKKINNNLIKNNKYIDMILQDTVIINDYLETSNLLNKFISYSKNELLDNSKEVVEVERFMENDIDILFKSLLTDKQIEGAEEKASRLFQLPLETIREYLTSQYETSVYNDLSLEEAYILNVLCNKYLNKLEQVNIEFNKKLKYKRGFNLNGLNDLYNKKRTF